MSVNVSARQLTEGSFSNFAEAVLKQARISPETICVEVTESALMQDNAVRELHRLREVGIRVAVDDFGTGYSSLAYLQSLPVDIVKLDRTFVSRLGASPRADAFFAAILSLAHTLDIGTVAEGCETEAQWDVIARGGCKAVQGWLIARAADAEGMSAFLDEARFAHTRTPAFFGDGRGYRQPGCSRDLKFAETNLLGQFCLLCSSYVPINPNRPTTLNAIAPHQSAEAAAERTARHLASARNWPRSACSWQAPPPR